VTNDEQRALVASLRADLARLKDSLPDVNAEYVERKCLDDADVALRLLTDLLLNRAGR
jgi:hypothetical protein